MEKPYELRCFGTRGRGGCWLVSIGSGSRRHEEKRASVRVLRQMFEGLSFHVVCL